MLVLLWVASEGGVRDISDLLHEPSVMSPAE